LDDVRHKMKIEMDSLLINLPHAMKLYASIFVRFMIIAAAIKAVNTGNRRLYDVKQTAHTLIPTRSYKVFLPVSSTNVSKH